MGQSVDLLAGALGCYADVTLVVPQHFQARSFTQQVRALSSPPHRKLRAVYWFNPYSQAKAAREVAATKPDVTHLFNGQGYLMPLILAASSRHHPLLVTVHDPVAHAGSHSDEALYQLGRRLLVPRSNAVHAMSEYAAGVLRRQGVPATKLVVTRHGTLEKVFTDHDQADVAREDISLFFGRWEYYKGLDILVEAFIRLAETGQPQRCILAGPGRASRKLYRKIYSRPDLFEVHNCYLTDSEVSRLFQRSNRTVLPYRNATQSSLPAIAQAYGHTIVATRVGAFEEEVNALGGVVVDAGSIEALQEGLKTMPKKAIAKASVDYSWDSIARTLVSKYRELL
jgi:glycosyltransferase involved in cell wall biosynthesis